MAGTTIEIMMMMPMMSIYECVPICALVWFLVAVIDSCGCKRICHTLGAHDRIEIERTREKKMKPKSWNRAKGSIDENDSTQEK